jgi:hypothetical protein
MYIDPNTGGMLFQILGALFAAVSGMILIFSGRIRQFIARRRRRSREDAQSDEEWTDTDGPAV